MKKLFFVLAAASSVTVASAGVSSTQMSVGVTVAPRGALSQPEVVTNSIVMPEPVTIGYVTAPDAGQLLLATAPCPLNGDAKSVLVNGVVGGCWTTSGSTIYVQLVGKSASSSLSFQPSEVALTSEFKQWARETQK